VIRTPVRPVGIRTVSLAANANSICERVYLLDAHGLIFQMFHGVASGMSAADGRPTNAVFGVARAIFDLYDHGAEYLVAAFDTGEPTFRDKMYKEYKAHREPPPPDLLVQEPMIDQVLEAMRIPLLRAPGYEADDIIATLAAQAAAKGCDVFLCTSDKDCRQLLSHKIKIQNLRKQEILDVAGLQASWGVRPDQVVDFQALVGDSVDNVPGVPGCGPKTAAKWLQQYDTLDNLVAHADEVGGSKLKDSLKKAIADGVLELSRKLVRLRTDVPIAFDWVGWRRREWDGPKLLELFQTFGFRTFAQRVKSTLAAAGAARNNEILATIGEGPAAKSPVAAAADPGKLSGPPTPATGTGPRGLFDAADDFAFGANAPADGWSYDKYELVDTPKKFDAFLKKLKAQRRFAFDLETTGLDPITCEIVGLAFSWQDTEAYYLAVRGPAGAATLDPAKTITALKPILENPTVAKVNQNIKYDQLVLRAQGVNLAGVAGDSMVAHYLLHSGERSHNLDDLTKNFLNHENISITELIGKGKKQLSMADVPTAKVKDYSCEDADTAWRLVNTLERQLETENLRPLYDDLEIPLIEVLAELEYNGVRLDQPVLARLSVDMQKQLDTIEKSIHALAGKTFNIASPVKLREILFDEMKLPVQKRTDKTGEASTDQESLERLAALGHPLPKAIIEHRQVAKLKGTYVDALPALVNKRTGRVHTSFNQTVAATGRLSSSDPNLQNIPARSDQGKQVRQAFVPAEGWRLVTADYSQVELRLLAHFSGDENMREAFAQDKDIHASVAAQIFKVPEAKVEDWQRRVAKMVNFGVIYGMSAHGLGVRLGMPRGEAGQFIDAYFARFPKVLTYQDQLLARVRETGTVSTILGRRRSFDKSGIRPNTTYQQRSQPEREAINTEIQGSAADLMKQAMLNVYQRLRDEKLRAKMVLTVHDELVFDVPPDEVGNVAEIARGEMAGAMTLAVPLKVDVAAGPNWLDVTDV
jgi:DNA polymerase-1